MAKRLEFTDGDGDTLIVEEPYDTASEHVAFFQTGFRDGCYVTPAEAVKIISFLAKQLAKNGD